MMNINCEICSSHGDSYEGYYFLVALIVLRKFTEVSEESTASISRVQE
jgi:hypothetical protein